MRRLFAACAVATFLAAGCGPVIEGPSSLHTVGIPQTKIKDQRTVGFCWAYTLAAFVESAVKRDRGIDVNISEEAIGFYGMAHRIKEMTDSFTGNALASRLDEQSFQGNWTSQGLDLVKTYGLVPEFAFNFKFGSKANASGNEAEAIVKRRVLDAARGRRAGSLTLEEIFTAMVAEGAWPSRPPTTIRFAEGNKTPRQWMQELGFNPNSYKEIYTDYDTGIAGMKRAMLRGYPVPFSFTVFTNYAVGADFWGRGTAPGDFDVTTNGNHAVLVTDFVNAGSRPGAMSSAEIAAEYARPAADLKYIVFKNSWGTSWQSEVARLEEGYFTMDQSYLRATAERGTFSLVLPNDIADNPRGAETPVAAVTGTDDLPPGILSEKPYWHVIADSLNCRAAPGRDNPVVTSLSRGTVFYSQGFANDPTGAPWMQVVTGTAEGAGENSCFVRATRQYLTPKRIGHIYCPAGSSFHMVGREGGRYCETADHKVVGPHPRGLVEACAADGNSGCDGVLWNRDTYLRYRGVGVCPVGTWFDSETDYCTDGENAFGPFSRKHIDSCIARQGGNSCNTPRWGRNWLIYIQSPEN